MLIIQDKLVSNDVINKQFLCNLKACKGACCWEGDFGAPLEEEEIKTLDQIYDKVAPFLTEKGREAIAKNGTSVYYKEAAEFGTSLQSDGACSFMTVDELGIAKCGIEQAHQAGVIDFKKPISCHLYPIRVNKDERVNFEAINYDAWDICSAACELGKKEELPVYKFLKEPLIRKYGEEFYEELDAAAEYMKEPEK